ncbi:MAG: RNA pseudouridine synthase [Treponema sp.]|jgi:23S rRNA pseudouridine1911/1915/1917 synthase|nr:RNA pseudouridine synthase [Treponema sp.]
MEIIFENKSCVVVNKASGESAEPLPPGSGMIDLPRLLAERPGVFFAVHRLDVPVSGCVLFAKNRKALSFLGRAFAEHSAGADNGVKKIYWAVVETPEGEIPRDGEYVHWIGSGGKSKSKAFNSEGPGLKRAVLRCRAAGRGERYLFLEIEPLTGRRHQIRAQLAALGLHIKGDLKYGAKRSDPGGGIHLHARSLSFPDPIGRGLITAAAPPPTGPEGSPDRLWRAFEECGP